MREVRGGGIGRRICGAALLALAPLLLAGDLEIHLGHTAGPAGTPIFSDARHAGQANHWEAAETVTLRRCAACLLPGQPGDLQPAGNAGQLAAAGRAAAPGAADPPSPSAGRSHRPRAPPFSSLS